VAAELHFDDYAEDYEGALDQGLSVSGEGKDFFARGRIEFLSQCLRRLEFVPSKAMDFGCGTGASAPSIRELTGATAVLGIDTSARSIERANSTHAGAGISFSTADDFAPTGDFDLVYTNGVFHHIPPVERPKAFGLLRDSLRPGGLLALWENNPWSPGARIVMSRIPFDRDAIMISARSVARLARAHGFRVLRTDYLFIFPAALKVLRPLEGLVRRIPAGAQYQVLCEKL